MASYTQYGITQLLGSVNNGICGFEVTFPYEATAPANVQTCTITINPPTNPISGITLISPEIHVFYPGYTAGSSPNLNSNPPILNWTNSPRGPGTGPVVWTFNRNAWDDAGNYQVQIVFWITAAQALAYGASAATFEEFPTPPPLPSNAMTTVVSLQNMALYKGNTENVMVTVALGGGGGA